MHSSIYLRKLIREQGYISIATFMEHAASNYYAKEHSIGKDGDFITSPEISQIFGEMLGIWCAVNWQNLGCPTEMCLIELGPGKGTLMQDILRSTKHIPNFHQSISVHLVESSQTLTKIQKNTLSSWQNIKFTWHKDLLELPEKPCLFVANEFFDALPIYQYIKIKNNWYEQIVTTLTFDGEYCLSTILSSAELDDNLNYQFPKSAHRSILETSPSSTQAVKKICNHIAKFSGYALVIDYGYHENPADRIYFNSTLQAIKNHKYHPILYDIGEADITAHVDFFSLKQVALDQDCNIYGPITQGEFLKNIGILFRLQELIKNAPLESENLQSQVNRLVAKDQMGDLFKVLSFSSRELKNNIGFDALI